MRALQGPAQAVQGIWLLVGLAARLSEAKLPCACFQAIQGCLIRCRFAAFEALSGAKPVAAALLG